jgi:HD superfamily phosphohydrolase
VRVAALVHDIGHGPFSHVIESILGFHHEDFTVEAVLSEETAIGRLLKGYSDTLASDVAAIVRHEFTPHALGHIVSSQLDVDRMDYLLRDSLMTGAKYGVFDLEWIIKSIEIDEDEDRLYISTPGLYAVEDYLQARYYMYRQVYFHRTLRSAEAVLRVLIKRALDLFASGEQPWSDDSTPMDAVLSGKKLSLQQHLAFDDNDVLYSVKRWGSSSDEVLSDLASRFLDRRLFKAYDVDMPEEERPDFVAAARGAVAAAGFDPEFYFVEDEATNASYSFYSNQDAQPRDLIYVQQGFARPTIREISEVSPAVRGLQEGYRIHRICFPTEVEESIEKLYHN